MGKLNSNKLNNLQQRLIAGIFGSAIIITALVYSSWGFFFIFLLIAIFAQLEFYKLVKEEVALPNIPLGLSIGLFNYFLTFEVMQNHGDPKWYIINFPLISVIFISELYAKKTIPFTNISFTILGILYVSVPFTLIQICVFSRNAGTYSYEIAVGILLMLWASDTGAYIAGRTMGKRKLFERISPKKTWEGFLGGLVLSLIFAAGISYYFKDLFWWEWIAMSVIIVVIGTYGDLVESLFKRSIDIKDSGNSILGHGGFLDRFDGLIISLPFLTAFLILF